MPLPAQHGCDHTASEMDAAANADGLCPICLHAENAKLMAAIARIDCMNDNPSRYQADINAVCDTILRPHLVNEQSTRAVGMDWELSDETKAHLAEIDRHIKR